MNARTCGIQTRRKDAEITVSLLPVMAARWLVPRLSVFTALFPHINLHIKTGQSLANFKSDGVDIAIRFGRVIGKGCGQSSFSIEEFFPVCSPGLNGGRLPKRSCLRCYHSAADRPQLVMARLVQVCRFEARSRYRSTSFTDTNALMEAAVTGQGIGARSPVVARSEHSGGKLVRLSEHSLRVAYCHYAVYPIASESPGPVAFRDWLLRRPVAPRNVPQRACRLWKEQLQDRGTCSPYGER